MPPIPDYVVDVFNIGTVTRVDKDSLPKGAASDSLNWLTRGDRIELRRGMARLGSDISGNGRVTGLEVGRKLDGTEIPFRTRDRKIEYFDATTEDWIEVSTNVLPAAANAEDVAMDQYHNLAGAFMYLSSPSSSIYKIPIANPGSHKDLASTSHRGYIRIKQGRMFLWTRKDSDKVGDKTGVYGSKIDKDELSDYTQTTNENIGTGDGSEKTFTATLAAVNSVKTVMHVIVTDGTETFADDGNGVLVGDLEGTGTINYATGAVSVTVKTAPANLQAITADYYEEDSTSGGIADFAFSATRVAGEGFVFRQDDGGGDMMNVGSIGGDEYCIHQHKTWKLTLTATDTSATNLIYRSRVGIPYWRASDEIGEGLPYLDDTDKNNPRVRILRFGSSVQEIIPLSISDKLDLADYRFDKAVIKKWGEYLVLSCRHKDSTFNNTTFVYHEIWKSWDRLDYFISVAAIYNGALIGGDSISDNVFELFSGTDDDNSLIGNNWDSGDIDFNRPNSMKKARKMTVKGLIGRDQQLEVYLSYDEGAFVLVQTIDGNASYVDKGQSVNVGATVVGSKEVGGGSVGNITANPYEIMFNTNMDKIERLKVRFKAINIGFISVNRFIFKDIRDKGRNIPQKYVT